MASIERLIVRSDKVEKQLAEVTGLTLVHPIGPREPMEYLRAVQLLEYLCEVFQKFDERLKAFENANVKSTKLVRS